MKEKILVAYASVSGSTAEVAEAIAKVLREEGGQPVVKPVDKVIAIDEYDAIVLGSSIRGGRWLEDAHHFVADFAPTLRAKKVAYFTTCLTMVGDEIEGRKRVLAYMEPVMRIDKRIQPVGLGLFAGSLVPTYQTMAPGTVYGDHRNWDAIEKWAVEIAPKIIEQNPEARMGDNLLGMILSYTDMSYSDLHHLDLSKTQLDHTDLSVVDLHGASLNWADLSESSLVDSDLREANLVGAKLINANLEGSELARAILNGAALTGANLKNCNLQGADLNWADLSEADLTGAILSGAMLGWANLERADLTDATLTGAQYNAYTRWPEGFSPQEAGCVNVGDAPF